MSGLAMTGAAAGPRDTDRPGDEMRGIAAVCATFIGAMMIATTGSGNERDGIGLVAGVDYFNSYFWRGDFVYGEGRGVFFPFADLVFSDPGITLSWCGEYASEAVGDGASEEEKIWYAADFAVGFSRTFMEAVTVSAKVWYLWYYSSSDQNRKLYGYSHDESFFSGTVSVSLDALPLSPALIYSHDYYVDDYGGGRSVGRDCYVQFQAKHVFELSDHASLTLLGGISYYNNEASENPEDESTHVRRGISDMTVSADLSVKAGIVTVHGCLNYAFIPDEDWNRYYTDEKDAHRWWSGFGVSCSM